MVEKAIQETALLAQQVRQRELELAQSGQKLAKLEAARVTLEQSVRTEIRAEIANENRDKLVISAEELRERTNVAIEKALKPLEKKRAAEQRRADKLQRELDKLRHPPGKVDLTEVLESERKVEAIITKVKELTVAEHAALVSLLGVPEQDRSAGEDDRNHVCLTDLSEYWDQTSLVIDVDRVIKAALAAPDAPKLPIYDNSASDSVFGLSEWIRKFGGGS